MKKFTAIVALAGILFTLHSCTKVIGEGPVVWETRVVREFSEVDFGVPGEMIFEQADVFGVEIEAQRNIQDVIETYVSGNELKIRVRDGKNLRSFEDIRVIVKGRHANSLAVSGSGRLVVNEDFAPVDARLRVSGSGKIRMKSVHTDHLEVRISGSGSIEVEEGEVEHENISISGSGDVFLQPVIARTATTQTSGSGNIRLNVTDELDVRISGSGDVFYEGNPVVNVSVSGSGRLVKL